MSPLRRTALLVALACCVALRAPRAAARSSPEEAEASRPKSEGGADEDSTTLSGKVTEVDTVDKVGTKAAEGGFSFAPKAPPPKGMEVAVQNASLAVFFQEFLTGRKIPGNVPIVRGPVGAIRAGSLSEVTVRQASLSGGVRSFADAAEGTLEIKIPKFAALIRAKYDVQFTKLSLGDQGSMNLTLGGGGLRLSVPATGAGKGSCHFDASTRLEIQTSSPLETAGGDAVDDALRSLAAAVNENMLSLQDQLLHTIERGLCATVLASFSETGSAELVGIGGGPALPAWKAFLADMGLTPLELVVGLGLCCFGWGLGACCFLGARCCGRRRYQDHGPEILPLKQARDGDATYGYGNGNKGLLSSLSCCRRSRNAAVLKDDGM